MVVVVVVWEEEGHNHLGRDGQADGEEQVWEGVGHNHLGRDGRADGEEEAVAEGVPCEHLTDGHREADRRGEEEADHPLDDALHLAVPDLLRARHVDEAHAGHEGAEQVRSDEGAAVGRLFDRSDVRADREGRHHQEDVHLVARLHLVGERGDHPDRGRALRRGLRDGASWGPGGRWAVGGLASGLGCALG